MISFTINYDCPHCFAHITYTDEAPKFKTDRVALVENNRNQRWTTGQAEPPSAAITPVYFVPRKTKYVECTVCGGRIYVA